MRPLSIHTRSPTLNVGNGLMPLPPTLREPRHRVAWRASPRSACRARARRHPTGGGVQAVIAEVLEPGCFVADLALRAVPVAPIVAAVVLLIVAAHRLPYLYASHYHK